MPAGSISLSLLPSGGRKQNKLQVILLGYANFNCPQRSAWKLCRLSGLWQGTKFLPLMVVPPPCEICCSRQQRILAIRYDLVHTCISSAASSLAVGLLGRFGLACFLSFLFLICSSLCVPRQCTFRAVTDHVNAASFTAILWCWAEAVGICLLLKLHMELKAVV